jgi:hypothetical protein
MRIVGLLSLSPWGEAGASAPGEGVFVVRSEEEDPLTPTLSPRGEGEGYSLSPREREKKAVPSSRGQRGKNLVSSPARGEGE